MTWTRSKPWDEADLGTSTSWDERDPPKVQCPMPHYTYSIQTLAKRDMHCELYNQFVRDNRDKKLEEKKKKAYTHKVEKLKRDPLDPAGVDMAMATKLPEPVLDLPLQQETLYLERPPEGEQSNNGGKKN